MSQPSPKLIGAFVSLAAVLLVGLVVFFGSTRIFQKSSRLIAFFDQSVNGLNVGSPVKYRGVPIGTVERIMIRVDGQRQDSAAIPVILRINHSRLEGNLGIEGETLRPEGLRESIEQGMVARLSLESFITGQLFVEFGSDPERHENYRSHLEKGANRNVEGYARLVEVPSLSSSWDEVADEVAQLVTEAGEIDFKRLGENANRILANGADKLEALDVRKLQESVLRAADTSRESAARIGELASSEELRETVAVLGEAAAAFRETARSYDPKDGAMAERLDHWTTRLESTLDGVDDLVNATGAMAEPGSEMRIEFQNSLREISRAARSLRLFMEFLERNPNALLTGRPGESE